MQNPLYTISYFSRSTHPSDESEMKTEIDQILQIANKRNSAAEVTGALLYSGGYFVQVLEGPEANVEEIFESIQNDKRHYDIAVISNEHINERKFGEWSMALAGINKDLIPDLEGILESPEKIEASPKGKEVVGLLSDLLHRYQSAGV